MQFPPSVSAAFWPEHALTLDDWGPQARLRVISGESLVPPAFVAFKTKGIHGVRRKKVSSSIGSVSIQMSGVTRLVSDVTRRWSATSHEMEVPLLISQANRASRH